MMKMHLNMISRRYGSLKKIGIAALMVFLLAGCSNQNAAPQASASEVTSPQASPTTSASNPATPASPSQASPSSGKDATPSGSPAPAPSTEKPLAPETSPVGDIPDTQAFVSYKSSLGSYSFKAPEGWARSEQGSGVSFIDKFDGVSAAVEQAAKAPTAATVKSNQAAALVKNGRAVKIIDIKTVKLPGGVAVWVKFESNSEPNPVTNKQIRQENQSYYFYKNGNLAIFTVWAPLGADNVDQWKLMSDSFRWN
jgi:hypothetical protein